MSAADSHRGGAARRRVTRGYVLALIGSATLLAASLVVLAWGLLAMFSESEPVSSEAVPAPVGPVLLGFALAALAWGMWRQALALLRGRRTPYLGMVVIESLGGYLLWCLGGVLAGMTISETWLSPYAWLIVPTFALSSLTFWAVLARRVYTDRPVPRWPWEKRDESGPEAGWRDHAGPDR